MIKKVLITAVITAISGCGGDEVSILNNLPGEDSSAAVIPGQGFDSVSNKVKGHCIELGDFVTQTGSETGQIAEFRMLEINSETKLREALNISASGSLNFAIGGKGSARMDFASSVNAHGKSRFLLVHTRVANQLEVASSFKIKNDLVGLLESDKQVFLKHCGNEFVYGRRTGGEFFAIFEYNFSTQEEDQKFSAAISSSGLGWKASGTLNSEVSKFNMSATASVKLVRFGGNGELPDVDSLEDFARNFSKMTQVASGAPVTLELLTTSYDAAEPVKNSHYALALEQQLDIINQISRNVEDGKTWLNTIKFVLRNADQFKSFDQTKITSYEKQLNAYINAQLKAYRSCIFNVMSDCLMPDAGFPSIVLPERAFESAMFSYPNVVEDWGFSLPTKGEQFSLIGDDQTKIWTSNKYLTVATNHGTTANFVIWFNSYKCSPKKIDWSGYSRLTEIDAKGDPLMYAPRFFKDFLGSQFQNHTFLFTKNNLCLLIEFRQENSDSQMIHQDDGSDGIKVILNIAKSIK